MLILTRLHHYNVTYPFFKQMPHGLSAITEIGSPTSTVIDFDFLMGNWTIHNRKLRSRLSGCTDWDEFDATLQAGKILNGTGNMDQFCAMPGGVPFFGMAVRLFNPATRLWSIFWSTVDAGTFEVPMIGSFEKGIGWFYARDVLQGRLIDVWFKWDATDASRPVWSQAFSADNGRTWEWNWYMHLRKE